MKLNIVSTFDRAQLTAKLFCIIRNFEHHKDHLLTDKKVFEKYIEKVVEENFETGQHFRKVVVNLQLYVLGNENNIFSKCLA